MAVPRVYGHQKSRWPPRGFLSPSLGVGVNEHTEQLFPMPKLFLSGEIHPQKSPHYSSNSLFPLALDPPTLYLLSPKQQCIYQAKLGISESLHLQLLLPCNSLLPPLPKSTFNPGNSQFFFLYLEVIFISSSVSVAWAKIKNCILHLVKWSGIALLAAVKMLLP